MGNKYQSSPSMGFWVIGAITVAVFGIIIFLGYINQPKSILSKTSREVALTCTTDMATQFHIHPILKIKIAGQEQELPANIGVEPNCMMSLHTHDNTGVIHVEAPEQKDFTLGDFFAVWKKDIRSFGTSMKMMVNDIDNTEYEDYIMRDKDRIELIFD